MTLVEVVSILAVNCICINGFPELSSVSNNTIVSRNQTPVAIQEIFPSICMSLTCDGIITKWLFVSSFSPLSPDPTKYLFYIETWREENSTSGLFYRTSSSGINSSELRQSGQSDYEYELKIPIKVQVNDTIGLRFPMISLEQPDTLYRSLDYQDYGSDGAPASYFRSNASDMFSITSSDVSQNVQFLPFLNPIFASTVGK